MFLILAVSVIGSGAISIVWLRMEISATAKNCGKLEDQREMVARELRELRGKKIRNVEAIHHRTTRGGKAQSAISPKNNTCHS